MLVGVGLGDIVVVGMKLMVLVCFFIVSDV